nr:hypothetical protein [Bacillota bacterium]
MAVLDSRREAGFTVVEVLVALAILLMSAAAIYYLVGGPQGPLALRLSRERAHQAQALQAAVEWARANSCELLDQLQGGRTYRHTVSGSYAVEFRIVDDDPAYPDPALKDRAPVVEASVQRGEGVSPIVHRFILTAEQWDRVRGEVRQCQ